MTRALRTTVTLAVLAVLVVVGAAYGWSALTKPVPSLKQATSTDCVPTTVAAGDLVTPDQVTVSVINSGNVSGLAERTLGLFTAQGFYEGEIGNAAQGVQVDDPQIWTDVKGSAAVALVRSRLPGKVVVQQRDSGLPGITVVVSKSMDSLKPGRDSVKALVDTEICAPPS